MLDLRIERLRLNIENAAGHEHRIEPIVLQAVTLMARYLDAPGGPLQRGLSGRHLNSLNAEAVDLNLSRMSDEQAAEGIARRWAGALTVKPDGQN
jgi:hypothetical protein